MTLLELNIARAQQHIAYYTMEVGHGKCGTTKTGMVVEVTGCTMRTEHGRCRAENSTVDQDSTIESEHGTCGTTKTNVVIDGVGCTLFGGYTIPHVALSYVSSGVRFNEDDLHAKTANRFIIGMGSDKERTLYSRFSNDKHKYVAAMESLEDNTMIWTDYVSLPKHIPEVRKMSEIGHAYSAAHYTIAVLEEEDAKIVLDVRRMLNTTMRGTSIGTESKSFRKRMSVANNKEWSWWQPEEAEEIISATSNLLEHLRAAIGRKGQFSYWSRAWTMQEQQQSSTLDYSHIVENRLRAIVSSSELVMWCNMVMMIMKNSPKLMEKYDSCASISTVISTLFVFMTGVQRRGLSTEMGGPDDADVLLIIDIICNPRCATDNHQMIVALCIALRIFVYDETEQWHRALGTIVAKGFFPFKKRYGIYRADGWLPEGVNVEADVQHLSQPSSVVFKCFIRYGEIPQIRMFIDYSGRLAIRSYLVNLAITKYKLTTCKGEMGVMDGVVLVDYYRKFTADISVIIRDRGNPKRRVKVKCEMVYEKKDRKAVESRRINNALLVGGGAFVVLNKERDRVIASILVVNADKRKWRSFYLETTDVGRMVSVKLQGADGDAGYY